MRPKTFRAAPAAIALATTLACSDAAVQPPTSCHSDVDCPMDARCHQETCTADAAPRATITGPRSATLGAEVTFDAAGSSDADDEIVAYTWSVRILSASCAPELGASGLGEFHPTFTCAGDYEIMLVVRDRTGVVSEPAVAPLTVSAPP